MDALLAHSLWHGLNGLMRHSRSNGWIWRVRLDQSWCSQQWHQCARTQERKHLGRDNSTRLVGPAVAPVGTASGAVYHERKSVGRQLDQSWWIPPVCTAPGAVAQGR